MGYFHTTPNKTKLFIGSAEVFIADYVSNYLEAVWQPLGVLSALALTGKLTTAQPEAVNGKHSKIVTEEGVSIAFSMQEIVPENMKRCMGDLTTIEIVTAAEVVGSKQNITANTKDKGVFIPFNNQNHAGASVLPVVPENIVITEDPAGTPRVLTLNDDYQIAKDEFGRYGIIFTADGSFDKTKLNEIELDYTPIAETIIHQGGKTEITEKMVKLINRQSDGREITIIYYLCEFSEGGNLNLKKDGAAELIDFNVTLEAKNDTTKTAGKQLYREIIKESA